MRTSFHTNLTETGDYKTEGVVLTLPAFGEGKATFVLSKYNDLESADIYELNGRIRGKKEKTREFTIGN